MAARRCSGVMAATTGEVTSDEKTTNVLPTSTRTKPQ
jgi:DNA-binding transcriptional regulator YdaS (Cro superfamily)